MKNIVFYIFCFVVMWSASLLYAAPIYFPAEEKITGLLNLETHVFSLGAELKTGFLYPQGDDALAFTNGNQAVSHTNEQRSKFRIDRLMLIPEMNIQDVIKFHAELETSTQRNQTDVTFFREAYLSFFLPYHFFIKAGVEDRFISPEFMAINSAIGDNKKLTEVYPINGTAFWKDEDLGITWGGDHPIGGDSFIYWRTSLTNGLSVDHDELTQNQIYPILHDDRHVQSLNFDLTDNKEWGFGLGVKHAFSHAFSMNALGFFFDADLAARDVSFLTDVITGYRSKSKKNQMKGVNSEINISDFNLFTQYIYAKDGDVKREGFYVQPSILLWLNQGRTFLNSVRFLYRFNMLDVQVQGLRDDISTSPFTWNRNTHSFAMAIQIHKHVLFKNELHLNKEETGVTSNSKMGNDEFLSQLEFRF